MASSPIFRLFWYLTFSILTGIATFLRILVVKKILNEINSIINEIMKKNINDFNQIPFNPNSPLNKSIILYKNCIFILYSLTEFYEESDIYSQYNPFEIAKLVFSKEYDT